jgi:hypothetical protein
MQYQIKVTFNSDRQLTDEQLETLEGIIALQVEEPTDFEGNEMDLNLTNANVQSNWRV